MELIKACRICLVTGVKMNDLRCYPVVNYCEAIVGMTDPVVMDLPPYACYECTAHIRNTFFFKERCLRGQAALYQILRLTGKITETSINSVDRLNLNLISNLKHYTIADNSINISNEDIEECEVKDEPCNEFDLQEVKDVVVEGDDVFKDEIEFDDAASPVHFSSDDDDEPLSIHKSNSDKVHKKTEKKKGRKRKADVSAEIKDEEAMEEGNLEVEESGSSPTKKRGRPKKGEARPKKAQPSMSRRTRNTGGVEDNEINLEEYVTVIKLSKEEQLEEIEKRQHSSNYRNSQYKCDQCFKGFIDADAWQHHVSKHKPDEKVSVEPSTNEHLDTSSGESPAMDQPEKHCGESSTNELPVTLQNERSSERLATGEAPIEENVDHEPNIQTNHLISAALKTDIKKMFKRNMTAEEIMIEISGMRQHSVPEISQIKTCLSALRRANLEKKMINLKELKAWIDLNKNVPDNPQDVFIISDNIDEEDAEFLFALSSKSLIEIAKDAGIIHIDSRYKLMWQGFPAYVVGTTDRARKFHPLCLAVTSRELKDDFKLIFAGLQNQVQELFHVAWKAHVLVCNSTHAIQRAFVEVFGNTAQVRTCWNEVYRKMSGVLHNKNVYTKLFTDLNTLQSLSRPSTFIKASEAFVEKYQDLAQFVKKFKKLYLENRNWYVGAVPMSPDTNDALQTFVRKQTIQPHLNQCDFLTHAKELIKQWSNKYVMEPEENFFSKLAPITTWDWMNAYNWAKIPKEVTELNSSESHFKVYSVPSGEWTNFRGFQYHADKFKCLIKNNNINWIIKIPVTAENWQQGTCDCPAFPEKYTCKHVIGMAIRLRHVIAPLEARVYARPARQRKPYYNPRCHCRDTLDSDSDENEF